MDKTILGKKGKRSNMGMIIFTWIICALGIVGVVLNIKKNKWCFVVWTVANLSLMVVNFIIKQYPQSMLFFVYLGTSIWGYAEWKRDECKSRHGKVFVNGEWHPASEEFADACK